MDKIETALSQMEQWSLLSNVVNYGQCDKHPKNVYSLNVSVMNKEKYERRNMKSEEEQSKKLDLDFGDTPEKLKGEYLDVYKGIQSEILSITRVDENSG